MKRSWAVVIVILALLAFPGAALAQDSATESPGDAAPVQVYTHFIVVPAAAAGDVDSDQLMVDFKAELLALAGGYTELGSTTGGFQPPSGAAIKAPGVTFLVAASSDLAAQIKAWGDSRFASPVYVLVWQAAQYF